jgi:2-polyprenyl-6-methoxyphenol hydroxylase-like FAD-dependent oxidoreductase
LLNTSSLLFLCLNSLFGQNYYKVLIVEKVDVAIIGGGPGGATLANILASRGVSTVLVERQKDFSKEFRGEGLMPSGNEVLEQIGFNLEM